MYLDHFSFSFFNSSVIDIQYSFQAYHIVVWQLFTLGNDFQDKSSKHWSPHKVTLILLTVFPMLYITSMPYLLYDRSLHPLITFMYLVQPLPLSPLANTSLFSVSVNQFRFVTFIHLFCFLDSTHKWDHTVFVFLCLTYLM